MRNGSYERNVGQACSAEVHNDNQSQQLLPLHFEGSEKNQL